jgi:outer membrane lipoprotein-sorting protein
MAGMKIIGLAVVLLMLSTNAVAEEMFPDEIMKKVTATYRSMETYKAEGMITSDIDSGGMKMTIETSFTILLKKPNLYLITWTQKNMPMPGMAQSGAVWSDGTQPYLYMGMMNAYSKITNDEMALASATGISGGAAFTVPSLFLSVFKTQAALFVRLKDPKIEKTEKVGEEDCYVLGGPSSLSKKETYWISKTSHLIRKYSRSLEPPEEGRAIPDLTDKDLEQALAGMGQKVTPESKKNMREMLEKLRVSLKTATKMKGVSAELHAKVSSPELSKSDFKFSLPDGTVLKDSLIGSMLKANKTPADGAKAAH